MSNAHSLARLKASLYNVPHAITPESMAVVLDYLDSRDSVFTPASEVRLPKNPLSNIEGVEIEDDYSMGIGLLEVHGSLTYRRVETMCGEAGSSYQDLVEDTMEMAEAGCSIIIMEVASGGGMCSHCFETAREIRAICDSYNIKLIGYADEQACSAAYALLCICDVVVANPSAELGSIGVLVALMDTSEAMKQAGLKRIFITSGTNKVPFADDGTFKKSFLDGLQADVDRLNMEFAEHVSRYTGLSVETIMGFEADTFDAVKAVELGLANSVMTSKEFAEYIIRVKGTQ